MITESKNVRDVSISLVQGALEEVLREKIPRTRAANLVTVAEKYGQAIGVLLWWIKQKTPTKKWTAAEWERYCAKASQLGGDCERAAG